MHIRKNRDERKEIIEKQSFKRYYGEIEWKDSINAERRLKSKIGKELLEKSGEKLARKVVNNPEMIEILRYVAWVVSHKMTDEEILSEK